MAVTFSYADARLSFRGKRKLKGFIPVLFQSEGKILTGLNYVFCSDNFLLDVNRRFLNHDYFTDIITFDLSEADEEGISAEIYVSVERVKDNAIQMGFSFGDELVRVVFHGALHLCGYGDKTKREIVTMHNKEDYFLRLYKETI